MLQLRAAGARWQRALPNLWSTFCRGQENAHQKPSRQPRLRQPPVDRPADRPGDAEELKIKDWKIAEAVQYAESRTCSGRTIQDR